MLENILIIILNNILSIHVIKLKDVLNRTLWNILSIILKST